MASHAVSFTIPERNLGRADIAFEIKKDKEKLGELRVSNGAVVWFPKGKRQGYRLGWAELDKIFVDQGQQAESR